MLPPFAEDFLQQHRELVVDDADDLAALHALHQARIERQEALANELGDRVESLRALIVAVLELCAECELILHNMIRY